MIYDLAGLWQAERMSSLTVKPMTPEELRPLLHRRIDELPAEELELVERVLARLEMDQLWQQVREGFTQDWAAGRYDRLDETIREVRADLKQKSAA